MVVRTRVTAVDCIKLRCSVIHRHRFWGWGQKFCNEGVTGNIGADLTSIMWNNQPCGGSVTEGEERPKQDPSIHLESNMYLIFWACKAALDFYA